MRFLANENIPRLSIEQLRAAGYDVAAVGEEMAGAADEAVLARGRAEGRIILTFDRDYGELVFQRDLPVPTGVLYLRFTPRTPSEPAAYILELLHKKDLQLTGRFTVATRQRLRQRPLPSGGTV